MLNGDFHRQIDWAMKGGVECGQKLGITKLEDRKEERERIERQMYQGMEF